jgi:hypothetical protein
MALGTIKEASPSFEAAWKVSQRGSPSLISLTLVSALLCKAQHESEVNKLPHLQMKSTLVCNETQ